jgi:glutamate---cysteine ligase / carboxylate-amine ligase
LSVPPSEGGVYPETYASLVELVSGVCANAAEAVGHLARLRRRLYDTGATMIGAGLHPTGAFGDVVHYPSERYRLIAAEMRGLLARTPTCALHVHVGMPDPETAVRACNSVRAHLPLLQALAANSPFWHGRDSGLASARSQVFRAFPTSEVPPVFASFDEYATHVERLVLASGMPDYTFLWWDIRLHPVLGTLEVRAMDSQSSLETVAGLAALVHALACAGADDHGPYEQRDVLMESSFRAARDGLDAMLWHRGELVPARELARTVIEHARPHARDVGGEAGLEAIERVLVDGNGADRERAARAQGGLPGVLSWLVEETAKGAKLAANRVGPPVGA